MPSGAIGNGVKINHIFVEGGALEHGGGDDDDSDDSGGIYIFGGKTKEDGGLSNKIWIFFMT